MHDDDWQQHPQQYDYSFQRFTEDWSTKSDYGIIHSHHMNFSHRDGSSIIIARDDQQQPGYVLPAL